MYKKLWAYNISSQITSNNIERNSEYWNYFTTNGVK